MVSHVNGHSDTAGLHSRAAQVSEKDAQTMDSNDALSAFRDRFSLPDGIYLDGNSLGALPKLTPERMNQVLQQQWGNDLIKSWNVHDWTKLPTRIGSKIARLVGAHEDEVIACDSTSINVYKAVSAALDLQRGRSRRLVVSERYNFPTDLYMLEGLLATRGNKEELRLLEDAREILSRPKWLEDVAVILLTHVSYCTGRMLDLKALTQVIHDAGALAVWDLSHSTGAVTVDLNEAQADFAMGCGYKHLNGGPGAPAYIFVPRRHQQSACNPLSGWFGHKNAFAFSHTYEPADDINRWQVGTSSIIALSALEVGVDLALEADPSEIRQKSIAMGDFFLKCVRQECGEFGFELWSPENVDERGSHINFTHPNGYAIVQALIAKGVTGDFRAPDILRFGFTPLYVSFQDLWNAVQILKGIMKNREWDCAEFKKVNRVT